MKETRIRELILTACEKNDCIELANKAQIEWSNRMTSAMGIAYWMRNLIKLSIPIFALATEEQKEQTVVHEVCHLIARFKNPTCKSHGREWKTAMRKAGYVPERCHYVDCTSLKRTHKRTRYHYACVSCGKEYVVSAIKHSRLQKDKEYYVCGRCHSSIRLV